MSMVLKGKKKKFSFKRLKKSLGYSLDGLKFLASNEQNLFIMIIISIIVLIMGFVFKINFIEWATLITIMFIIIAMELINTAIEYTIDIAMPEKHPFAKIAKDSASAAVFLVCLSSIIIGLIIFVPKIIAYF